MPAGQRLAQIDAQARDNCHRLVPAVRLTLSGGRDGLPAANQDPTVALLLKRSGRAARISFREDGSVRTERVSLSL